MDFSLQQLRVFLAVARRLSFTRAAEDLYLTQPAVSVQVQKLERAAGQPLFEHLGKRVRLTAAGELLCRYAERMLALEEELQAQLAELSDACQGVLGIGASTTIGISMLPQLLQRFRARHPAVTLRLHIGNVPDVAQRVLDGQLDLGLIAGDYPHEHLHRRPFLEDELILLVPPGHRWAACPAIGPDELSGEPLVLRERGSTTRSAVEEALTSAGVALNVVAEMNNNEALLEVIELGIGVGIVSRFVALSKLEAGRLWHVPVAGLTLRRPLSVITQRGKHRTPVIRAFDALLDEFAGSMPSRGEGRLTAAGQPEVAG
jgi:DNA-binding transcriptional LysR family regulator